MLQYDDAFFMHGGPQGGRAWEVYRDLTAAQVQEKLAECRKRKWRPSLIHRHRTDADKFALVLIDNPRDEAWEYHVPLSVAEYEKKLAEGRAKGLRPQSVQSWLKDDVPAYSALWVGDLKPTPLKSELPPPPRSEK